MTPLFLTSVTEKVGIKATTPGNYEAEASQLVIGDHSSSNGMTIASGTSNVGSIYFSDGLTGTQPFIGYITYTHSTNRFSFGTGANAATRLAIDSDGIKFGTDTAAANALNDYEEGTWTPTWNITSGSWSGTFSGADYIKIGKQVTASVKWQASAQASGVKINGINGLPFTHANTGGGTAITYAIRKVGASNYILRMHVAPNLSSMNTGMSGEDTTTSSEFYPAHTGSQSEMYMSVTYIATA